MDKFSVRLFYDEHFKEMSKEIETIPDLRINQQLNNLNKRLIEECQSKDTQIAYLRTIVVNAIDSNKGDKIND